MMALLAKGLAAIVGPYAATLTIPALIVAVLVLGHNYVQQRDARIEVAATNICDRGWESEIRRQERDAAQQSVAAAQAILEGERRVTEGLKHELDILQTEMETLRVASAGGDNRCLSDGVLRAIEGAGTARIGAGAKGRPK